MLRFFRINDPYRLLAVLLVTILMALPLLINALPMTWQELKWTILGETLHRGNTLYVFAWDDTAPFTAWINKLLYSLWGRSILGPRILSVVIIFFQVAFFSIVLINHKAYNESTYLPAFVASVLCFFSFDLLMFSPELLASTFLLLSLRSIFKEIEFREQREETGFNIGLYIGIASLFIFSYVIFIFGSFIILLIFTRLSVRKALLLFFGFGFPHVLLSTYYYFQGNLDLLFQNFYSPNLHFGTTAFVTAKGFFLLGAIPVAYFFFSIVMLNREAHFTKYQSQVLQVMLLWLIIAFAQIVFTRERTPHSFYTFIPPLAYLISHYLLLIRRKWIAELMLWTLLGGILTTSYLERSGRIKDVPLHAFFPSLKSDPAISKKKIWVLGSDFLPFAANTPAASFLNWTLAQPVFEQPDLYQNVEAVEAAFRREAPDVIIDPNDYMNAFLKRIPAMRMVYKREGESYLKTSN